MDFPHEVRFFAGIGPAHFPAETTRPLGRGCLPFSPYLKLAFSTPIRVDLRDSWSKKIIHEKFVANSW